MVKADVKFDDLEESVVDGDYEAPSVRDVQVRTILLISYGVIIFCFLDIRIYFSGRYSEEKMDSHSFAQVPHPRSSSSDAAHQHLRSHVRSSGSSYKRLTPLNSSTRRVEPVPPGSNDYRITRFLESVENKQVPIVLNQPRRVADGEPHDEAQVEGQN